MVDQILMILIVI